MSFVNVEIKARTANHERIREILLDNNALFAGIDDQRDTYFNVRNGRLKLRQGNIENNLIYYHRPDEPGPKKSDFDLIKIEEAESFRHILTKAIGIKIVVKKTREIYYIENVKFHLDSLEGLGEFVEIEASNKNYPIEIEKLYEQCGFYKNTFGIKEEDLINISYSDMVAAIPSM